MFLSCGNTNEEIQEVSKPSEKGPDQITEGVTLYSSDFGKTQLKLESPLMYQYGVNMSEATFECPIGVKVTFYDTAGQVESILTSKYGELRANTEYIFVRDSVVFKNYKKEELNTELLHVDFKKDCVYTHEKVVVSSPKGTISGVGLHSNSKFTVYKVHNINNGVYNFEDNELKGNKENE